MSLENPESYNKMYSIAPAEGEKPISFMTDKYFEALCNPCNFPYGTGTLCNPCNFPYGTGTLCNPCNFPYGTGTLCNPCTVPDKNNLHKTRKVHAKNNAKIRVITQIFRGVDYVLTQRKNARAHVHACAEVLYNYSYKK